MPQKANSPCLKASLHGHKTAAFCVAYSPDGKTLASVGEDGRIRLWDTRTFKEKKALNGRVKMGSVAFSPNGKRLATADSSGRIRLWSLETGKPVWTKRGTGGDASVCVAFSPDGKALAIGSGRGIRLVDARTGSNRVTFPEILNTVASLAFSPNGKTMVSGTVETGEIRP